MRPPCCSRVSWPLVVSMTDSIHWRTRASLPNRAGSSVRSGRTRWAPSSSRRKASNSAPAKALVAEDHIAGADEGMVGVGGQQRLDRFPLADLGVGQSPHDRHPLGGGDQVEPEAPEVAGVAGAVAVAGMPGQIRALDRLPARRRTAAAWSPAAADDRPRTGYRGPAR